MQAGIGTSDSAPSSYQIRSFGSPCSAEPELSVSVEEGFTPIQVEWANDRTEAEINTSEALFSGQRMEKRELN